MTALIGSCLTRFYPLGYEPGGLRTWWRRLHQGSDDELDNTHLMRMAGVRAPGQGLGRSQRGTGDLLQSGERKHRIAEEYLATHEVGTGCFGAGRQAPAPVWR
ncbi:hypothetical protein [Mycobacterium riyadhense]|uniref:hypothetical protein n=1 Tax=Mycobacterium riyadhense TaxID=486698 RepID=UPI00195CB2D3|nr:hypothetical protein [Mycobacterium riyadhense]